jgi:hypothetical protein
VQALPHAPQLRGSVVVSVQRGPPPPPPPVGQVVGHAQAPATQAGVEPPQFFPQAPQLAGSDVVSTQAVPHVVLVHGPPPSLVVPPSLPLPSPVALPSLPAPSPPLAPSLPEVSLRDASPELSSAMFAALPQPATNTSATHETSQPETGDKRSM